MSRLLERYPGSKRRYQFFDDHEYTAIVEPFVGSGSATLEAIDKGAKYAFIADADPTVAAVWRTWITPWCHELFYKCLESYRQAFFQSSPTVVTSDGMHAAVRSIADIRRAAWDNLKEVFENPDSYGIANIAAASLVLRKLTFGGVVRINKQGKLNVTYCNDQIEILKRWQYRLPHLPKNTCLSVGDSWQQAFNNFAEWGMDPSKTICVIDPPYWLPFETEEDKQLSRKRRQVGLLTPAYPGHKPHDTETLDMCLGAVKRALELRIRRVVVTNYISPQLSSAIESLASEYDYPLSMQIVGRLDGINRTRATTTQNTEAIWVLGETSKNQLELFTLPTFAC